MYTAVIFDLDGTILNTIDDLANAGNHMLSAMHYPTHSVEYYKTVVGHGIQNLVSSIIPEEAKGTPDETKAYGIFCAYYEAHMFDFTKPYPGIVPLIRRLREHGIATAVLSNKNDKLVQQIGEIYFPGLFDFIMGFSSQYPAKPDPASTLELIRLLARPMQQVLYVGDSDIDIITALNSNIDACAVTWGFRSREQLLQAGAEFFADSPSELEHFILADA